MDPSVPYWTPIALNLLRYAIFAGLPFLAFYVFFSRQLRNHKIQAKDAQRKDFHRELLYSLQTIGILSIIGMLILFTPLRSYTQLYTDVSAYPLWWMPVSALIALLLHDTYFYWLHRLMHQKGLFQWVHVVHHRSTNPTPLAAYSFNLLEGILEALMIPIVLYLIPMHPMAFFGYAYFSLAYNVYSHLGFEVAPRWFKNSIWFEVWTTSVYHNLHHKQFRGNYGFYFRFWDRVMGTENPTYVQAYQQNDRQRFGTQTSSRLPKGVISLILMLSVVGLTAQARTSVSSPPSAAIEGEWYDPVDGALVRIYQQEGMFYGELIAADNPDEHASIKDKHILVLRDFQWVEAGKYCCGELYGPKRDLTVDGDLTLVDDNTLQIEATVFFFSRKRIWKRKTE